MGVSFYIRLFVYIVSVSVMVSAGKEKAKKGLTAWRLGSAFAVLDILTMFFYSEPLGNRVFTGLLFIQCFLSMPLLSQISTCSSCGRRTYWRGLLSDRCPYCGKERTYR